MRKFKLIKLSLLIFMVSALFVPCFAKVNGSIKVSSLNNARVLEGSPDDGGLWSLYEREAAKGRMFYACSGDDCAGDTGSGDDKSEPKGNGT